jgi:hypothetical protein
LLGPDFSGTLAPPKVNVGSAPTKLGDSLVVSLVDATGAASAASAG